MHHEQLVGTVERITYYNEDNGYSVLRLKPEGRLPRPRTRDGLVTVVGLMPELFPGESVRLQGMWKTHRVHGRQFEAEVVEQQAPASLEGLRRYLGSGLIKGVGPKTAERIVRHFGLDTLAVLDEAPEKLQEVPGIGPKRSQSLQVAWVEQQHIKQVMLFLQSHRVSTRLAVKIFKTYGDESIALLQADPYRLAQDIYGIGFKTADQIARNLGLEPDAPQRIQAGIIYALQTLNDEGHVYVPRARTIRAAAELLEVPTTACGGELQVLVEAKRVILSPRPGAEAEGDDEAIYLPAMYHSERGAAERLRAMLESPFSRLSLETIDDWQRSPESTTFQQLSPQQQAAALRALTVKVSVLTGGPGTGKTTTLRAVIEALGAVEARYHLASPTGRAAKQLQETTGQPAQTIHRLLGFKARGGFVHHEGNPLDTDMLVIDEASMLDIVLFYNVLKALPTGAHLLLVGDVDQLPSVGPGSVLRDIIDSDRVAVSALRTIFRQAHTSHIITNAHRINRGRTPDVRGEGDDFFLFALEDPEEVADMIVELVAERIPGRFGFDPRRDIQVLVPMYRGSVGAHALNQRLQDRLTPAGTGPERSMADRVYRVGDKVMQTRNNYDLEVFNGDSGLLTRIDLVEQQFHVRMDDRTVVYDWADAGELMHAYAISVHRSQGSEYPVVVMPVVTQHYHMLQRNLLYTAVTRARQVVVLVGSRKAMAIAVKNNRIQARYSGLAWRLQA